MVSGPTAWNAPDFFVGKSTPLSMYEPYQATGGSAFTSMAPSLAPSMHWVQPAPVVFSNIVVQNSLAAGVPGATSQASSGTIGWSYALTGFFYTRQDYAANVANLSHILSASFGYTATLSYTSTAQSFGMSWNTDTAGGTSGVSTTSADAGWSNLANGARVFSIPCVTTLTAGEYWLVMQHSSSSATSNSNVTLVSMSQLMYTGQQGNASAGYLGNTTTNASVAGPGWNFGAINTPLTTSTTMASSAVQGAIKPIWFALKNA